MTEKLAEKYHLKWDAHLSYLNSAVSTLYKNEKFADVILFSSSNNGANSVGADHDAHPFGISAHKVILSSCSQYFATMFDNTPMSALNGGVLCVVLPPSLSHRAIQILVQYMYSGEATVSHDILNEVLKGGEILKIRGLYRTPSSTSANHHNPQGQRESAFCYNGCSNYSKSNPRALQPTTATGPAATQLTNAQTNDICDLNSCSAKNISRTARYVLEQSHHHQHQQQQQHKPVRELSASIMPKDSPVIVKSPKLAHSLNSKHSVNRRSGVLGVTIGGNGISVNKEVAIDPESKCCYQMPRMSRLPLCKEVGCSHFATLPTEAPNQLISLSKQRHPSKEYLSSPNLAAERQEAHYLEPPGTENNSLSRSELVNFSSPEHKMHRTSGNECGYFAPDEQQFDMDPTTSRTTSPYPHAGESYFQIKKEPADWSATSSVEGNSNVVVQKSMLNSPQEPYPLCDATVKLEMASSFQSDEEAVLDSCNYTDHSPVNHLACDVCRNTFSDPKTWVRHMETHAKPSIRLKEAEAEAEAEIATEKTGVNSNTSSSNELDNSSKSHVPRKRRKVSENNLDHVTLLCDLCSTSFDTPAEWVHHMNNLHTEIELALFNNGKRNYEQKKLHSAACSLTSMPSNGEEQPKLRAAPKKCACDFHPEEHGDHSRDFDVGKTGFSTQISTRRSNHGSSINPNANLDLSACSAANSMHTSDDEAKNAPNDKSYSTFS